MTGASRPACLHSLRIFPDRNALLYSAETGIPAHDIQAMFLVLLLLLGRARLEAEGAPTRRPPASSAISRGSAARAGSSAEPEGEWAAGRVPHVKCFPPEARLTSCAQTEGGDNGQ
jgi:hypothetical protein